MLLLLLMLCFGSAFASVIFEDCGSAYDLQSVMIEGCGMMLPCRVTLGEQVPVSLVFRANFHSQRLDQDVVININQINLRTAVSPELCDNRLCPVMINAVSYFTSVMSVPVNMALNQRGYLHWRIYNESGVMILCYSVLVQTQSPLQKLARSLLNHTAT